MLKLIIGSVFYIGSIFFSGAGDIEYENKSMVKALEKFRQANELKELIVPDSIEDDLDGKGKFFRVAGNISEGEIQYIYVGRVNSCRSTGCAIGGNSGADVFEYFDYFVFYDKTCTVKLVKVFNYQATKGQEITARNWLKQFEGYNASGDLSVGKQIDGISGATISALAITNDIGLKSKWLKQMAGIR
jgi:Na+-translocating ferredoxin:NAD+ oxidoreductase RnfG subunit